MRPGVAITAAPSDDEPTDTGIEAPPKGFKGFLAKIKNFTASFKKKKAATASAAPAKGKVALAAAPAKGKANGAKASGGGRKLVPLLLGLLVGLGAAGGGAYYYLFLMSPIPSGIDVSPGDREVMIEVVKQKEGHRLFLAQATGSEENPADVNTPKYYVVSNLPEGTQVNVSVTGVPGTIVNKMTFEKTFTAALEKNHIATFAKIDDDGKPVWGEVNVKVTAEGAEPFDAGKRFIGNKGGEIGRAHV